VTASNQYCCGVELGQATATVINAGFASGAVPGVSQINFQIPVTLSILGPILSLSGASLRVVGSDGSLSRPVTLYIRN
jgi:uncharacterized protein (TIGR03437 family)